MIRVAIVDDEPVVIHGLVSMMKSLDEVEVVLEAGDGEEFLSHPNLESVDIVLLDINLHGENAKGKDGVEIAQIIFERKLSIKVIMLSMKADPEQIKRLYQMGVSGYLIKGRSIDDRELMTAFTRVTNGEIYGDRAVIELIATSYKVTVWSKKSRSKVKLTKRNIDFVRLTGNGVEPERIAEIWSVVVGAVYQHRHRLFHRLEVQTPEEMIVYLLQEGVIDLKTFNSDFI